MSFAVIAHIVVFGEAHLRRTLAAYAAYYNGLRTHLALEKDAPLWRPIQSVGRILTVPILGGLHHQYVRMAYTAGTTPADARPGELAATSFGI